MKRFGPINGWRFPPLRAQRQKNPPAPPHPEWATCRSVQESPRPLTTVRPARRSLLLCYVTCSRGVVAQGVVSTLVFVICLVHLLSVSRRVTGGGRRRRESDTFCEVMQSDTTARELIPPYCVELLLPFVTGDGRFLLLFELFWVFWRCKAILKSAESRNKWESVSKSNSSHFIIGNQTYIKVIRLEKPICKDSSDRNAVIYMKLYEQILDATYHILVVLLSTSVLWGVWEKPKIKSVVLSLKIVLGYSAPKLWFPLLLKIFSCIFFFNAKELFKQARNFLFFACHSKLPTLGFLMC